MCAHIVLLCVKRNNFKNAVHLTSGVAKDDRLCNGKRLRNGKEEEGNTLYDHIYKEESSDVI